MESVLRESIAEDVYQMLFTTSRLVSSNRFDCCVNIPGAEMRPAKDDAILWGVIFHRREKNRFI